MKIYLLPEKGNFYKANMHMHTTISDGNMTPEETRDAYMQQGYSIVAFTDHDVMIPHNELNCDGFMAITSHELEIDQRRASNDFSFIKTYHLNVYSPNPDSTVSPAFYEPGVWAKVAKTLVTDEMRSVQHKREYSIECVNDIIAKANEAGFLVSYNHPVWSLQDYSDYKDIKGAWGVELHNTGCVLAGYPDTVQPIIDLARAGQEVYPLATDDAHSLKDCFGGWIMIKADKLEYDVIFEALRRGDFYASNGPEIYNLYFENGIVHVDCSNAKEIRLITERRTTQIARAEKTKTVVSADFDISRYLDVCKNDVDFGRTQFFLIEVIDNDGNTAYTKPYFVEKLK